MKTKLIWGLACFALVFAPLFAGHYYLGLQSNVSPTLLGRLWVGDLQLLAEALVVLPLAVGFAALFWSGDVLRLPAFRVALPAVLLVAWILVSIGNARQEYPAVLEAARWSASVMTFFLVAAFAGRGAMARGLLFAMAGAGTAVAIWGLWEFATNAPGNPGYRVFSTFYNPGFLSGYLCMSLLVTLGLLAAATQQGRLLISALAAPQLLTLVLTGTRFGLVAFVFGLAVFFALLWWFRAPLKPALMRVGAVVGIAVVLIGLYSWRLNTAAGARTVQGANAQEHSRGFRVAAWSGTLKMAQAQPLRGHGIGTFQYNYTRYSLTAFTLLAHQSYLQLAAEIGFVGLGLFVLFGLMWFSLVLQRERRVIPNEAPVPAAAPPPPSGKKRKRAPEVKQATAAPSVEPMVADDPRLFRAGVIAAVAALLARCFVDSDLAIFATLITFFALLGLGLSLSVDAVFPEQLPRSLRKGAGVLVAATLIFHFSLVGVGQMVAIEAMAITDEVRAGRAGPGALQEADRKLQQALGIDSHNPDYVTERAELALAQARTAEEAERTALPLYAQAYRMLPSARTAFREAMAWQAAGERMGGGRTFLERAAATYERALAHNPKDVAAAMEAARLAEQLGNMAKAEQIYRRVTEQRKGVGSTSYATPEFVETRYAVAHEALARLALMRGDRSAALLHLEAAIRIFDEYREITRPLIAPFVAAGQRIAGYSRERDQEVMGLYLEVLGRAERLARELGQSDAASRWVSLRAEVEAERELKPPTPAQP